MASRSSQGSVRRDSGEVTDLYEYQGCCHCGNLRRVLRSRFSQSELPVRACQCGFCRKHAAMSTSDPHGAMNLVVQDATAIVQYRVASQTAEFLICARCDIYLGAQMEEHGRFDAIANLRTFEGNAGFAERAEPTDYAGEKLGWASGSAYEPLDSR
jgi:hypothetical protein